MSRHQIAPAWQTSRGPLVRASGCAVGVPVAGMRVFGETRQNLWVNTSGTNAGITCTSNEDGSLTISGTNATGGDVYLYSDVIEAIPYSKQVTFSASNYGVAGEWRFVLTGIGGATPTGQATFTAAKPSANMPGTVAVVVTSGTTVNATVRVMLNEGPTAEPWCPPGLTSVSELSVVSAGKNLLDIPDTQTIEAYGGPYTFTMDDDGWVSCSKDSDQRAWGYEESNVKITLPPGAYTASIYFSEASTSQGLQIYTEDGTRILHIAGGPVEASQSFSLDAAIEAGVMYKLAGARARVQLELGSTATSYEPPAVSTTPIDLSGHQLRSLPDGTRDMLTVDGSGAVSVEQAVKCLTIDGTNVKAAYKSNFQFSLLDAYRSVPVSDEGVAEIFCDSLPVTSAENIWKGSSIGIGVNASGTIVFAPPGKLSAIEDANAWLAQHPVTVIYPVATTTTVPLDPITTPTVPASDATLWAASDVPCELEATTWTASGAEQGRQQAALVKLAQQVRSQAETVAALAAQSLEA